MADVFSPAKRSQIMSKIRGKDTTLELEVRSALWRSGLRFRTHYGKYKIDIALPGRKIAIFIDSCFWHGCPTHYRVPRTRALFWSSKIARNKVRDAFVTAELRGQGWAVMRVWGHQIEGDLAAVARRISGVVAHRPLPAATSGRIREKQG
jgi:DNA mismatch endonuclease (patch repair protein)